MEKGSRGPRSCWEGTETRGSEAERWYCGLK